MIKPKMMNTGGSSLLEVVFKTLQFFFIKLKGYNVKCLHFCF